MSRNEQSNYKILSSMIGFALASLLLLLIPAPSEAQTTSAPPVRLKGQIVDGSDAPVSGAWVTLWNRATPERAVSRADGAFEQQVPSGPYVLQIRWPRPASEPGGMLHLPLVLEERLEITNDTERKFVVPRTGGLAVEVSVAPGVLKQGRPFLVALAGKSDGKVMGVDTVRKSLSEPSAPAGDYDVHVIADVGAAALGARVATARIIENATTRTNVHVQSWRSVKFDGNYVTENPSPRP
jgi:hypothetical protein